jgi:hypothetical protein
VLRKEAALTKRLVHRLSRFRMHPTQIDLPLAHSVVVRLRRRLGHNCWTYNKQWWADRKDDLARLSGPEFVAKHGKTPGGSI